MRATRSSGPRSARATTRRQATLPIPRVMTQVHALVPVTPNGSHEPFPPSFFAQFEALLRSFTTADALSGTHGWGQWRDDDREVYHDDHRHYMIEIPPEGAGFVVKILEQQICYLFDQKEAFVRSHNATKWDHPRPTVRVNFQQRQKERRQRIGR